MMDRALTVTQLNGYVRTALEQDPLLQGLTLRGEVSKSTWNSSGHWYFTVKDEQCAIDCVMFRSDVARLSFRPQTGDAVLMTGRVSLYPQTGRYQFYCRSLRPDGVGDLYRRFERLKERLSAEGLFDAERKRPLPVRPRKIAVLTSPTGAVWHDICHVAAQRDASIPIVLWPCRVQGVGAAEEIAAAIPKAAALPDVDVLIVGRGGGSTEDLWSFNEEVLAWAIAACPIPVISAVGHETDFTIADFVADVRAATPSHAAELAVPDRGEYLRVFAHLRNRMEQAARSALQDQRLRYTQLSSRLAAQAPEQRLTALAQRLQLYHQQLQQRAEQSVISLQPRLTMAELRLENAVDTLLERQRAAKLHAEKRLNALNPLQVLQRGYAMVLDEEKHLVPDAGTAKGKQRMVIRFRDGILPVQQEEEYGREEKAKL